MLDYVSPNPIPYQNGPQFVTMLSPNLNPVAQRGADLFAKCFGYRPRWLAAAPGRVNLIGEHTDYNSGFVLPMAIDRYTVIVAQKNSTKDITVHSETTGETAQFSARGPLERGEPGWSNYVRGVVAGFQSLGRTIPGFDAVIVSSLPYGGGLASSAALEVAVATLLELATGPLEPLIKAKLCQHAEHEFAGVPCGIMDQFTSILARENEAILLDCRSEKMSPVPMKDPGVTVLVINTNVRHQLAQTAYAQRRAECEAAAHILEVDTLRDATMRRLQSARTRMKPNIFRRARHVVSENERTLEAAEAIRSANWKHFGELMFESHRSLRDDYRVSCPELDVIVEIAEEIGLSGGMFGCRMTGAGFGGCAVSLVQTEAAQVIARRIAANYEERTRTQPMIFSSRPVGGAVVIRTSQLPRPKTRGAL